LEPGVTVVVGPNGSGKSNIADAVMWVLGEQSAKSLRGQSMEDVIFAGSSARKPVGVAEVDIVFDNSDRVLPLEFEEVTITRRMFRSGESEYLVNSSPARLMDIHDILSDTGLGRDTHSIIGQGRLEEILQSRPEDRRLLIEEAAGILKHKKRKQRALRKLASMDGHVDSARQIIREIDRQLRPLERQAERARQHDELSNELRDLEIALAVQDLRVLQARWDEIVAREEEQSSELDLRRYRLSEKEEELERFQRLLEEKGLFAGDLSEQRRRLEAILERLGSGLLLLEEKGKNLVDRLSELRAKIHHSESRLKTRRLELEGLADEQSKTTGKLEDLYQRLGELRRETEKAKKERLGSDEELASSLGEERKARKRLEDLRDEVASAEQALASARLETDMLSERREALGGSHKETSHTLSVRRGRLDQLEGAVGRTRKELALADADVDKRVRVVEARRRDMESAREEGAAARAELKALEDVDRAFQSAAPGLAWAISKEGDVAGMLGPLSDLIDVDREDAALVEQALGSDLFSVVVRTRADAIALLELLSERGAGEVAVLPLEDIGGGASPEAEVGEPLADRVTCEGELGIAVRALLGDVRVVETLEEALSAATAHGGARFATSEGHIVWPSGKITLGPAVDASAGVLSRRQRMNELADALDSHGTRIGELEVSLAEAEEALTAAQQDALELGQRLATQSGELGSLRDEVERLEASLASVDRESEELTSRMDELGERTSRDRAALDALSQELREATEALEVADEAVVERRAARDELYRAEAAISAELSACQVDIATVSEREVHLKRRSVSATSEIEELEASLELSRSTEHGLELLRERIQPVHDLYEELLEHAEHWAHSLRDRARLEQSDSASLRDTIQDSQSAVREIQSQIESLSQDAGATQVEKAQLEVQVKASASRIVDGYGVALESALEIPELEDVDDAEESAHRLRKRLSNLGPVNPIAVEEYEALAERRGFLETQLEDLLASKKALQRIVAAIDKKMRNRFLDTFEKVDENFQDVFGVLFPGGKASLSMTDPDDPVETGIEVSAQPRGKRLQRMSLMSGGEKALVALALLFALYHTRPCPFYILDEVEAALDDVNLRRFIGLVDALRGNTQFVVVTHQRRTMETADLLYGVSMQADGVSKVVSERLERASSGQDASDEHAVV
jgi:chromosome segregation protein